MTMTTEELEKEILDVIGKVMAQSRKIIDEQRMKIADLQAANKAMMLQANTDGGNAQPVQPSALQRLEEWLRDGYQDEDNDYRDADISIDDSGVCRCALTEWSVTERDHHFMESHRSAESNTLEAAVNDALDAAEGRVTWTDSNNY